MNHELGLLLAIFIGVQNFPEAFNSYRDLKESKFSSKKALLILFVLSFVGVIGAVSGYFLLTDHPKVTSALMLFSSGGILYLIFHDIAPDSKMPNRWLPTLGANLGFLVGMIGNKVIG